MRSQNANCKLIKHFSETSRTFNSQPGKQTRENKSRSYSSVYQIALTYAIQSQKLVEYLIENASKESIIILHDAKHTDIINKAKYNFQQENL